MSAAGPLAGVRVLEVGSAIAGPHAGRLLADLGARVFKVEPPEGDVMRSWGVPAPDGTAWAFKVHNRNKRLLAFDLHDERDRKIVRAIALRCDVFLENFRPGRLDAWGLGAADLRREKPELIYASISGFGHGGNEGGRAAFGSVAEAIGGLRYVTGYPDLPPARTGINLGDEVAAMYAVIGILASLFARTVDGRGERVDVSLVESCVGFMQGALAEYAATGKIRERKGYRHDNMAPNSLYRTRDAKWIIITAVAAPIFRRLCAAMGQPELAADPRFGDNHTRTANADELDALIEAWTSTLDAADALAALADAQVPSGPVNSIADIAADPYFRERGAIVELRDATGDSMTGVGLLPRLAERRTDIGHAAGDIGADTEAVLRELELERELF